MRCGTRLGTILQGKELSAGRQGLSPKAQANHPAAHFRRRDLPLDDDLFPLPILAKRHLKPGLREAAPPPMSRPPRARWAPHSAPVAQLDRAPDYESGGQRFESFRARHLFKYLATIPTTFATHHCEPEITRKAP